jgi:hypothetical protein
MRASVFVALLVMIYLLSPINGYALIELPNIGINYRTMKVTQSAKLTAAGMKSARNGDKIFMQRKKDGFFFFKNLRTNEELTYPPAKLKEEEGSGLEI